MEGELPLLVEAGAADLHSESAHPGTAAVQTEVTAHVTKLRVGLNLLPFLLRHDINMISTVKVRNTNVHLLVCLVVYNSISVSPVCCRSLDSLVV